MCARVALPVAAYGSRVVALYRPTFVRGFVVGIGLALLIGGWIGG